MTSRPRSLSVETHVSLKRMFALTATATVLAVAACDDDPTAPAENFNFAGCPTGTLDVNAPIALNFTSGVLPSTVTGANVVVTNANTGFEVPGSLALSAGGNQVIFTPSSPLPFGTALSIRVQNIVSASGASASGVTVCTALTA